jgi:hypothetical protein
LFDILIASSKKDLFISIQFDKLGLSGLALLRCGNHFKGNIGGNELGTIWSKSD